MAKREYKIVKKRLFWSYANLAMAHTAVYRKQEKYGLMEWMNAKERFPPLMILRRYLKLIIEYCEKENLMDSHIEELRGQNYPFNIELVPLNFTKPNILQMIME
jgi:hypothetical protein